MAFHVTDIKNLLVVIILFSVSTCKCQQPLKSADISNIRIAHPSLLINDSVLFKISNIVNTDSAMKTINNYIIAQCNDIIQQKEVEKNLNGRRMLAVSNEALRRICYLSFAYNMTKEERFAHRAIKELKAICNFNDWNPNHFLDVAEMTMAVAIGYDWLYDKLSEADKSQIVNAIDRNAFDNVLSDKHSSYTRTNTNWNSVCNAGMVFGAIALMNEIPEKSIEIIRKCLQSNPQALKVYGPDGCYPEGYAYWGYGTLFEVLLLDALQGVYETDFGLSDTPGFLNTGKYIKLMEAPSGLTFNFSDTSESSLNNIAIWWFASKTNDESLIYGEAAKWMKNNTPQFSFTRLIPMLLIFASRVKNLSPPPPRYNSFSGKGTTPVYMYRSGWNSKKDAYLAVKGGSASTSHSHMDAGSFVYEYDGVRWAGDLGVQDYGKLEQQKIDLWNFDQDSQRWDILRMRNDYHNTLTVNNARHNVKGMANIEYFFDEPNRKGAVIDMTTTLGNIKWATREVSLDENSFLNVTDSIETDKEDISLNWIMVTKAQATITNDNAILLQYHDQTMKLTFNSVLMVKPMILSTEPIHNYDAPNNGTLRVGYQLDIPARKKISVKTTLYPVRNLSKVN